MGEWIKCGDGLPIDREIYEPSLSTNVLTVSELGVISVAFWDFECLSWWDLSGQEIDEESFGFITHWMPLPAPPSK